MADKIIIGVDLGGTNLKLALLSSKGSIIKRISIPTSEFKSKKTLLEGLSENITALYKNNGFKKSDILGVGIGVPGLVDSLNGIVKVLTNIKGWKNVPLKKELENKIGVPVFVDNDVNVIALGEYNFGRSRKAKNFIAITLGTGVGGGIILDGKLYRGSTGSAGEFGHIPLNEDGPKCNCGGMACLEAYVGNSYIIKDAVKKISCGRATLVKKLVSGNLNKITPEILSKAARAGDKFAKEIWNEAGRRIGIALSGVINFLDIDTVVIGGGLSKAGEVLFAPIRSEIRRRAMKIQAKNVKILPSGLQEDAGLLGAAVLVKINV